jgi:hypothetical protein
MKTIKFTDDNDYPGSGWALARIDNDTIIDTHPLLHPEAPAGLTADAEAEWHLERAADFAQTPGPGQVFYGMVSCYEFCHPQRFTLDLLPTIGRQIGEELTQWD